MDILTKLSTSPCEVSGVSSVGLCVTMNWIKLSLQCNSSAFSNILASTVSFKHSYFYRHSIRFDFEKGNTISINFLKVIPLLHLFFRIPNLFIFLNACIYIQSKVSVKTTRNTGTIFNTKLPLHTSKLGLLSYFPNIRNED